MTIKCESHITFTDAELEQMASTADSLVVSKTQFGSHPVLGLPKGLRVDCPKCGRQDILVLPFCTGGGSYYAQRVWHYRLRVHSPARNGVLA